MKTEELWQNTLDELERQMTKATFDRWLRGAHVVEPEGDNPINGRVTICLHSQQAVDWVSHRLNATVCRTLEYLAQRPVSVAYRTSSPLVEDRIPLEPPEMPDPEGYSRPLPPSGEYGGNLSPVEREALVRKIKAREACVDGASVFPGFEPLDSNWTQVPDMFFNWVLSNAHGVVVKIVGQVIHQTLGTFEDKRRNRRREEWPVNNATLQRVAGISSKTSLQTALWDARADGYVILRPLDDPAERRELSRKMGYRCKYTLRIRYPDDAVDTPEEARPGYGSSRQDE